MVQAIIAVQHTSFGIRLSGFKFHWPTFSLTTSRGNQNFHLLGMRPLLILLSPKPVRYSAKETVTWKEYYLSDRTVKMKRDYKEFMTVPGTGSKCFKRETCSFLLLFNKHCDYPESETPDSVCLKVSSPFSPPWVCQALCSLTSLIFITAHRVTLAMRANKRVQGTILRMFWY